MECSKKKRRGGEIGRYIPQDQDRMHEWMILYLPLRSFSSAPYTHEGSWGFGGKDPRLDTKSDERIQ